MFRCFGNKKKVVLYIQTYIWDSILNKEIHSWLAGLYLNKSRELGKQTANSKKLPQIWRAMKRQYHSYVRFAVEFSRHLE